MSDRPNFLVIMSDEHGPMWSSAYGHPFVRTPNMERLAAMGATFDAAYCNAPLCVPSRLSFMTGRYVSGCEGWDNAKPLPSDVLTFPYALRSVGYDTALAGKMHLVGQDDLHGFGAQLSYDAHGGGHRADAAAENPALSTGGMHPIHLWDDGAPTAAEPWQSVKEARAGTGPMIDADDATEAAALAYLRDPARRDSAWALCVGFVAPHFPFIVPERWFSMYWPKFADLPDNPPGHLANLPPAARRLRRWFGFDGYSDDEIRRARAAYYGLITYLDDKIGSLLDALDETGMAENTVVVHTSDHGESLGEHGLWRKMNFYEQSARVPLQIAWPRAIGGGRRFSGAASLVDATATILDAAGVDERTVALMNPDGVSLLPQLRGEDVPARDFAFSEHLAHGTDKPMAMLREGRWKLIYGHGDPSETELYNLETDPGEFRNLADDGVHTAVQCRLAAKIMDVWGDADALDRRIRASQRSRLLIRQVMGDGAAF